MSQLLEVNEYQYSSEGLVLAGTVKVVPTNVVKIHWETELPAGNRFKVYLANGRTFITDWAGTSAISNWGAPFAEVPGPTGPMGPTGPTGDTGPMGPTGPTGGA